MVKKFLSSKTQCFLALIPYIGFFIAWICSWINIFLKTKQLKYVFLHYFIFILPMCLAGGLIVISMMTFMDKLSFELYRICALILAYVACLIMAFSSIAISRFIIKKYELRTII